MNEKRNFSLTSDLFTGEVTFEFTNGILSKYDASAADLNEKQAVQIAKYLPRNLADADAFLSRSKTAKFVETTKEITFDMFWKRYFSAHPVDFSSCTGRICFKVHSKNAHRDSEEKANRLFN